MPKDQVRIIGAKVESMVTITVRVIMSEMKTTTATKTSTWVTTVTEMIGMGPMSLLKNREVTSRDGGDSMARVEDMLHKMMRRFDASDENIKELRSDVAGIGKKVHTHAISIKQIELQMAQLSVTVNTR